MIVLCRKSQEIFLQNFLNRSAKGAKVADFTEDTMVEQPATALFEELGWETMNCFNETFVYMPLRLDVWYKNEGKRKKMPVWLIFMN